MAEGILYLDVDDEITSAAARVRAVPTGRVAVVLPFGSRVATSRINFRLLARDAMTHEKRLSVVASDPATRALAASAGLPVFATVQEYEASLGTPRDADADSGPVVAASAAEVRKAKRAAGAAGAAGVAGVAGAGATPDAPGTETARVVTPGELGTVAATGVPTSAVAAGAAAAGPAPLSAGGSRDAVPMDGDGATRRPQVTVTSSRGGRRRNSIVVGLAVLALALLVGGVGAYVLLPSATIVVTPKTETLGPIQVIVTADPNTTQPDAADAMVPAQTLSVDVTASDTFSSTGKRVVETAATGTVRFKNQATSPNTIPAGSIVSSSGGVRFRTVATVRLDAATIDTNSIDHPTYAFVAVIAVRSGPEGNLGPDTIQTIPPGEGTNLFVTNPDATTGGTRQTFPKVTQADVDAALVSLNASLEADLKTQVEDPALAPAGTTVFPETATLGPTTPTVDPASLVGTEAATFDLGLSATGTVIAVDEGPVKAIAATHLRGSVAGGSQLVEDSIEIKIGTPVVVGQTIKFPVTASATQVAVLDPAALEAKILGKSEAEAKAILAPYGTAVIKLSPDWVTTIPTFENRVDLTIATASPTASPGASPSP